MQTTAMDQLRAAQQGMSDNEKTGYGWRRSQITWYLGPGTWALLSRMDVPPGSSMAQVQQAAQLAEERAKAATLARPPRPQPHAPAAGPSGAAHTA